MGTVKRHLQRISEDVKQKIIELYKKNINNNGKPNYKLITEYFANQKPPISVNKQMASYWVRDGISKGLIQDGHLSLVSLKSTYGVTSSKRRPIPPHNAISSPVIFAEDIKENAEDIEDASVLHNLSSQDSSGTSSYAEQFLKAKLEKSQIEAKLLKIKLDEKEGNIKDADTVKEEQYEILKVVSQHMDALSELFFSEISILLTKGDIKTARATFLEAKQDYLLNVEKLIHRGTSGEDLQNSLIFSKKKYNSPLDWAEKNRVLHGDDTKWPGPFSFSSVPYMREIAECFGDSSPVQEVAFKKGVQVMATTCLTENIIGYYASEHPCNMLVVFPTLQLIRLNPEPRIYRMFKGSGMSHLLRKRVDRNTISYDGGQIYLAGAKSPDRFRNISVRVLILEELSGFPITGSGIKEGSVKTLARNRTKVFESNRKILYISSALRNGDYIDELFSQGDCRYYHVPCPKCRAYQVLKFQNLKYKVDEYGVISDVFYVCAECGFEIEEKHKTVMFSEGKWVSTAPERARDSYRSYHLSGLYSPLGLQSWGEICAEYEKAKESEDDMQVFQNTILGENYTKTKIISPSYPEVMGKVKSGRIIYNRGTSPVPILYVTIGVDVQKDRLELEIVGWCEDKVNFSIDYLKIYGDPDIFIGNDSVWSQLSSLQNFIESTKIPTVCLIDATDSAERVYDYVHTVCQAKFTFPIIGEARPTVNYPYNKKVVKGYGDMVRLHVNTPYLKNLFFSDSFQTLPFDNSLPSRYVGFPIDYNTSHFMALYMSERPDLKIINGRETVKWVKLKDNNHPLDCRVYALAGAFWIREWVAENVLNLDRVDSLEVEGYLKGEIGERLLDIRDFKLLTPFPEQKELMVS